MFDLFFITSVLCISCHLEVRAQNHAVTCHADVCDGWQHRKCSTGINLSLIAALVISVFIKSMIIQIVSDLRLYIMLKKTFNHTYVIWNTGNTYRLCSILYWGVLYMTLSVYFSMKLSKTAYMENSQSYSMSHLILYKLKGKSSSE